MRNRLFGLVMFWTITTTILAWLPLVRILGRPEGYHWGVLGLSGSGTEGPFWIFLPATAYAVTLFFVAHRGPRAVFYPMLLLWHVAFTAIVFAGTLAGGPDATFQGQGLHWEFPLWFIGIPCAFFTALAAVWVVLDHRAGGAVRAAPWTRANTRWLVASLLLLGLALGFFAAGTNYNWVTAVAIVLTVVHWIVLAVSFGPRDLKHPRAANGARAPT